MHLFATLGGALLLFRVLGSRNHSRFGEKIERKEAVRVARLWGRGFKACPSHPHPGPLPLKGERENTNRDRAFYKDFTPNGGVDLRRGTEGLGSSGLPVQACQAC